MASGKAHFAGNVAAGLLATGITLRLAGPELASEVLVGATIGTIITPDLDLEGTTYTERLLRQVPGLGLLWQVLWYGYAMLTRHRGISHLPLVGTASRYLWLVGIALIAGCLVAGGTLLYHVVRYGGLTGQPKDLLRPLAALLDALRFITAPAILWHGPDRTSYT